VTLGIHAVGVRKGDRFGIVSRTRSEWSDADLAILTAGAITVGIYPTAGPAEMAHIISHSGCRLLLVENDAILARIMAIRGEIGLPERVVLFETERKDLPAAVLLHVDLKRHGQALDREDPQRFEETWRSVRPARLYEDPGGIRGEGEAPYLRRGADAHGTA
jgi:long-chain acyl-CoA synthetase